MTRPPNFFANARLPVPPGLLPRKPANATGRDADPRRALPLNGSAWQRLRASVLSGEPLCRHCAARGIVTEATDVDHISGDPGDNSSENLQPLCHSCHSRKTASDHGKRVSMGCDVDGLPLDPAHPWAKVCSLLQKTPECARARPAGSSSFTADCPKNRQP